MAFSERVKKEVRKKACCRCIICHKPFVEIHHIIPLTEGGSDNIENAAPLCAYCHDIFGNNPNKRKQIQEMRDIWYEIIERRYKGDIEYKDINKNNINIKNGIAIYHLVYQHEDFEISAKIIYNLLINAQKKYPGSKRYLYLEIEGHRNKMGGYDQDMLELQKDFLLEHLMRYFTEMNLPLIHCKNPNTQENNICEKLLIVNAN
nr:HNH endonuclease signature motif containing protein [uncultured Anaerocolumna sp.]